jgi:hypothetical protein
MGRVVLHAAGWSTKARTDGPRLPSRRAISRSDSPPRHRAQTSSCSATDSPQDRTHHLHRRPICHAEVMQPPLETSNVSATPATPPLPGPRTASRTRVHNQRRRTGPVRGFCDGPGHGTPARLRPRLHHRAAAAPLGGCADRRPPAAPAPSSSRFWNSSDRDALVVLELDRVRLGRRPLGRVGGVADVGEQRAELGWPPAWTPAAWRHRVSLSEGTTGPCSG